MSHLHSVYDNDTHFRIDPVTRQIKNETGKIILMQNDHNSERFTFELPRYIDGHDMSVCNKVEVHFINLKADKTEKSADVYPVEDLQVSPDSEEVVICSWLISQNATKHAGSLNFVLRFACLTGNVIDYQWYTDIHKGISVSESISNTKSVAIEHSDILERWRLELFDASEEGVNNITTARTQAIAAINTKKAEALQEIASKTVTAAAIVETASGEFISVSDSSDSELQGLKVFGKTTQNGIPTPEAPVALESVGDGGSVTATVCGKNLFDINSATNQSVDASGVVSSSTNSRLTDFIPVMEQYVTISGNLQEGITDVTSQFRILCYDADKNFVARILGGKGTIVTKDVSSYTYIRLNFFSTEFVDTAVQMEWGNTATEFEPYSGSSVTFSTPNGLPGIPVTSGGNYTDENGQQWVCDEVDFEKGVYIKRIEKLTAGNALKITVGTSGNSIRYAEIYRHPGTYGAGSTESICNAYVWIPATSAGLHGTFKNYADTILVFDERFTDVATATDLLTQMGFDSIYYLKTPIETALSEEELTAYAALHTNYPNTTVFNDGGAGMEVKYVADTKLYIDNKFAELANAMLNN